MSRHPGSLGDDHARRHFSTVKPGTSTSSPSGDRLASPTNVNFVDVGGGDLSLSSMNLASSPEGEVVSNDWGPTRTLQKEPLPSSTSIPTYPKQSSTKPSGNAPAAPTTSSNGFERQAMSEWAKRSTAFAPSRTSLDSFASGGAYYSAEEDVVSATSSLDRQITPPTNKPTNNQEHALETPGRTSSREYTSKHKSKGGSDGGVDPLASPTIHTRRTSLSPMKTTPRQSSAATPLPSMKAAIGDNAAGPSSRVVTSASIASPTSASPPGNHVSRKSRTSAPLTLTEPLQERSSSIPDNVLGRTAPPSARYSGSRSPSIGSASMNKSLSARSNGQKEELASPISIKPLSATIQAQTDKDLLQRWILSIGMVNFDLEKGPDLERLWPPLDISKEEKDNIAFSSFPDTSIFDVGDISFSFRVREVPLESSTSSPPKFPPSPSLPNVAISPRSTERTTRSRVKEISRKNGLSPESGSAVRSLFSRAPSTGRGAASTDPTSPAAPTPPSPRHPSRRQDESTDTVEQDLASDGSSIDLAVRALVGADQEDDIADASAVVANEVLAASSVSTGLTGGTTGKISNSSSSSYIYGYAFFRQKRDSSIRRGYFQKSLVILSHLPYVALFGNIVGKLGPLYFELGEPILEAFANAVTKWPNPSPGSTLPLPTVGNVLWVQLPLGRQSQTSNTTEAIPAPSDPSGTGRSLSSTMFKQPEGRRGELPEAGSSEEEPLLASIPITPLVEVFKEALADMWLVWECVLLAEPIFVIGPDPKACSEAVWHLLDICRPVPHAGDFRPFFTIHDYDFKNLAARKNPPAGTIIGCTNAFMAQACSHWPHVLRVGKAAVKLGTAGKYGSKGASGIRSPGVAGGSGAGGGGPEHLPGFVSKRKRRISKDRPLLKKIMDMVEKGENVQGANAMLRRYFTDITERFLAPLNRYISSLIPAEGAGESGSKIKPFDTDAFLASLKAHGTPLPIRSRSLPTANNVRQGLYLDFLRCPNFAFYLSERITFYRTRNPVPAFSKTRFEQASSSR